MTYYTSGSITFSKPVSEEVIEELIDNLEGSWYIDESIENTIQLDYDQTSDLEDDAIEIERFALENGLTVDGVIEYGGDYDGYYVFENSAIYESYDKDAYAIHMQNDEDIIRALEKRKREGTLEDTLRLIKEHFGKELMDIAVK